MSEESEMIRNAKALKKMGFSKEQIEALLSGKRERKSANEEELEYEIFHVTSVENLRDIIEQGLISRALLCKDNIEFVDYADNKIKEIRSKETKWVIIKRGGNSLTHGSFSFIPNDFVPFFFIKPIGHHIVPRAVFKWISTHKTLVCYLTINKQKLQKLKHHISILHAISTWGTHCLLEDIQLFDDLLFNRVSIPNEINNVFKLSETFERIRKILKGKIRTDYLGSESIFSHLMDSEVLIEPPIPYDSIEKIIIHPKAKKFLKDKNLLKNSKIKENGGIWFPV